MKNLRNKKNQSQRKKFLKRKEKLICIHQNILQKNMVLKHETKIDKPFDKQNKISFGFYSSLIILFVFIIAFSRILYFFQDFIILKLPFTEYYLKYFFESIRNIFEIWKDLISNY